MALITYTDKVTMNENASVPAINKVRAADMNEIKNVVNENYSEQIAPISTMMCNGASNTSSTSTTVYTQVPLTNSFSTGSNFTLNNNKIYVTSACTILISAQLYITGGISAASNAVTIAIRKNGTLYKRALCPIPNNYRMAQISGILISMNAGDYIDLAFLSGDKTGITVSGSGDTFITVEQIK